MGEVDIENNLADGAIHVTMYVYIAAPPKAVHPLHQPPHKPLIRGRERNKRKEKRIQPIEARLHRYKAALYYVIKNLAFKEFSICND